MLEAELNDVYQYANEGRKLTVGPMPVRAFLDEFLPPPPGHAPMPKCSRRFSKVPSEPRDDGEIYSALVRFKRSRGCLSQYSQNTSVLS